MNPNEKRIFTDANGDEWLRLNGKQSRIWRDWFVYELANVTNLAAGASITQQLTIQADSDFEWTHGVYQFNLANAAITWQARPIPNCSVLIVDQGSGRQLMNAAVPVENLFGAPWQPLLLPISKVFGRNSTVAFTITNFDAAVNTGQLKLTMLGYKIFYY